MRRRQVLEATLAVALGILSLAAGEASATSDALPTAGQVIERYIEALGGRDAIERLSTRICVGRSITDLERTPPIYEVIPLLAYSKVPRSLLVVERKADGMRCEGFDGTAGWVQDAGGIRAEGQSLGLALTWLINPQNALRLSEYFPGLEVTAEDYVEGRAVYVLEPAGMDRVYYSLHFDTVTGLLLRIGYYVTLEDYRQVDGVTFPFRVACSRKGGSTTYAFDLVVHNLPLDDALFAVPTAPALQER